MKENKNERLLILYEAIGEIDPQVATSTLDYKHKTNIKGFRLIVVLAACVCILAASLIVGMNLALGGAKSEDPMADKNNMEMSGSTAAPGGTQATADDMAASETRVPENGDGLPPESDASDKINYIQNILILNKGIMTQIDGSQVGTVLYNGKTTLIWSDGEELYVRETENTEVLKDALSASREPIPDGEMPTYKIWISFGDGRVVTPFLEYSEENSFEGTLFDYSPKVLPSDEFIDELIKIIK